MITTDQIKIIQTLLQKRFTDRQERLDFLSDFFGMEIKTTKDLTEKQAFQLIRFLKEGRVAPASYYARFDADNKQHLTILARCHELGWVVPHPQPLSEGEGSEALKHRPVKKGGVVDLERLGGWLISKRSPVKKALMDMNHKELSKIIFALENMIKSKYRS